MDIGHDASVINSMDFNNRLSSDATSRGYDLSVNNLKWRDAMAVLGRYFSADEKLTGWTESLTSKQIAVLQRPHKWLGTAQTELCRALVNELVKACEGSELASTRVAKPATTSILRKKESSNPSAQSEYLRGKDGGGNLVKAILSSLQSTPTDETYLVTAQDFKNWLKLQKVVPSIHIQAWFDAVIPPDETVPDVLATTAPVVSAPHDAAILATLRTMGAETQEARQKRRYDLCIAAGLQMPNDDYSHLPTGIGALARVENISTSAFSKDIKAYIASRR
jgi:hypothetical protein